MQQDMWLIICSVCYVFSIVIFSSFLQRKNIITKFTARKVVHLFAGLGALIVPFFQRPVWGALIAGVAALLMYFSRKRKTISVLSNLYDTIGEKEEETAGYLEGPFHYCLSIAILLFFSSIFFPELLAIALAAICIMIISDTFAAIIGKRYGKKGTIIPFFGTKRTPQGSFAFFITAFVISLVIYSFFGTQQLHLTRQIPLNTFQIGIYSFLTAGLSTIIEFISPSTWDDITIPLATSAIMYFIVIFV